MKIQLLRDKETNDLALVIRHKPPSHKNDWCTQYSIESKRIRKIKYRIAFVYNWKIIKQFFRWTPRIKLYKYEKNHLVFALFNKTFMLTWKRL